MLTENKWQQYGFPREEADIRGITICEINKITTAQDYFDYLNLVSVEHNAFHYICDDVDVIQVMPLDYSVYHVGYGNSSANEQNIVIAFCSSLSDEKTNETISKMIVLIKNLQEEYSILNDKIFFYQDFNIHKYNPKTLIAKYGTSKRFVYEELLKEE